MKGKRKRWKERRADGRAADGVERQMDGQTDWKQRARVMKAEGAEKPLTGRRRRIFILKKPTLNYNWKPASAKEWVYDVIISPSVEVSSWVREGRKAGREDNEPRWQDKEPQEGGIFLDQFKGTKEQNHKCLDGEMEEEGR